MRSRHCWLCLIVEGRCAVAAPSSLQAHWDEAAARRRANSKWKAGAALWQQPHHHAGSGGAGRKPAAPPTSAPSTWEQEIGAEEAMAASG